MEQMQLDEAGVSPVKKQAGQSGIDGNVHRRDRRVEIRFSTSDKRLAGSIFSFSSRFPTLI